MKKIIYMCLLGISFILISGCSKESGKSILKKRIQNMQEASGNPVTIEQIQESIDRYADEVETVINKNSQSGMWWKLLGTRYIDKKEFILALDAFKKALEFYPENPSLHYYIGLCYGYKAKTAYEGTSKDKDYYLKLAEEAYLNAVNMDPRNSRYLYALGALYAYGDNPGEVGLNEPSKAITYLQRFCEIEKKDTNGMLLLARAYYSDLQFDMAIEICERVISVTNSSDRKKTAEAYIAQIQETKKQYAELYRQESFSTSKKLNEYNSF